MHDAGVVGAGAGRHVGGQPCHQLVHLRNGLGDRGHILLAPAANLALEVIAWFAKVCPSLAPCAWFTACKAAMTRFISSSKCRGARGVGHAGQGLVPQHPTLHKLHDIKSATDDDSSSHSTCICATGTSVPCKPLMTELAFNRVGRGQQLGHRALVWPASHSFAKGVMSL